MAELNSPNRLVCGTAMAVQNRKTMKPYPPSLGSMFINCTLVAIKVIGSFQKRFPRDSKRNVQKLELLTMVEVYICKRRDRVLHSVVHKTDVILRADRNGRL